MAESWGLIRLDHVTKVTRDAEPHLIFGSTSAVLPAFGVTAILGRQGSGKTTLLQLLTGTEPLDGGRISANVKFSMLLNGKGFLHPSMTGIENAESLARIYGMKPKRFAELAVMLPAIPPATWTKPAGALLPRQRKAVEIMLAALLPYDCYLVDDLERLDAGIISGLIKLLAARKAGLIFTTYNGKCARQYAGAAAVITNRKLNMFETIKEAEAFYG